MFIILFLLFFYLIRKNVEHFLIYPLNAFEIPINKPNFNQLKQEINEILDNKLLKIDTTNFVDIPYYHVFDLDSILKNYLSDYITTKFAKSKIYSESKVDLVRKLYNMKWRDIGVDRHYIFNIDLLNPTEFFSFRLIVYLVITDLISFEQTLDISKISIQYIGIDNDNDNDIFNIIPYSSDQFEKYYRIKNNLYLML
jgi:hypothetical protein